MTRAFDGAKQVLAALVAGGPVRRAAPMPMGVRDVLCRECNAQILLAKLPSGKSAPLDRHPKGELVIVNGYAVTRGEHHGDLSRYVLHFAACRRAIAGQR